MLVTLKEICHIAEEKGMAVGAFNTPNLEALTAVIEAAEEVGTPVIISHAEVHGALIPMEIIAPIMISAAKRAAVPVCVHLDHGTSSSACMQALRLGFTSIMFDASALPYEQNVEKTAEVVKIAHAMGASVEAELGHILTSDDNALEGGTHIDNASDDCYTDPADAKDFVAKTGVDALAIAFGTAHGIYKSKPVLDLDRITAIKEQVDLPFVMHGGSGVSDDEFRTAIKNGIRKINYYTYMALAGGEAVLTTINNCANPDELQFHDLALAGKRGMKENARNAMMVLSRP